MVDNSSILLKAWDTYQNLIKGMGEACWKIRSLAYTVSFGILVYGFNSKTASIYLFVVPLAVLFFFLESGYCRIQDQYIAKSIEIETTINDILANEESPRFPADGISTAIDTPSFLDLLRLFRPKKFLFWSSYLIIIIISILLYGLDIISK